MGRGQVSVEAVVVIGFLLFLFVGIYAIVGNLNETQKYYNERWGEQARCDKIASIISSVYAGGEGARWSGINDRNIFVLKSGTVSIEKTGTGAKTGVFCYYHGYAIDSNADKNFIIIENIDGNVVVRNG